VKGGKEAVGRRGAEFVEDGMVVGLGTGSTVYFTLVRLAERLQAEGLSIRGVPTSVDTELKAREMGIPLVSLEEVATIDLTIDGADEIDPDLALTKGGGGALLREKVVAAASTREVIVAERSKIVERLGRTFPLPVEVVPFARAAVTRRIEDLGASVTLRMREPGTPDRTDNGNGILDCTFAEGIADPAALEALLSSFPGVVENGLFVGLTDTVLVAEPDGSLTTLQR